MANQIFCSSCGAGYTEGSAYCPMCGISAARVQTAAFNRQHQMHCTGCGAKTGPRDTYCSNCGTECGEYVPQAGFGGPIFGGAPGGSGFPDVAGGMKNFAPNLAQMKDRAVFAPAIVFALVSIAVGLVLSFLIDTWISGAIGDAVRSQLRSLSGIGIPYDMNVKLGPVTIWLLTCLGGLRFSYREEATQVFSGSSSGGSASFALGIVILAIVPIVALIVGRLARKAFINSQHQGKEVRAIDALCAAGIFAIVNAILSFFPSALGNLLNRLAADASIDSLVKFGVGARLIPLFLFSFIAAFILAMPSLKALASGSVGAKNKAVSLSCAAGAGYVQLVMLCGLVSAVVMLGYVYFKSGGADVFRMLTGSNGGSAILLIIAVVLNLAVWLASMFTGGSLALNGVGSILPIYGSMTISALGIKAGMQSENPWPGGLLLLVAGLWIAVTAVYKLLRSEQLNLQTVIGAIAGPAVVTLIVSSCATIGGSTNGNGISQVSMTISTASFFNLIMCAVFMALAVAVVYFAKKSRQLDDILSKLATTPLACAATAVATLVTCLTVKGL